jgi:hypothetical protein
LTLSSPAVTSLGETAWLVTRPAQPQPWIAAAEQAGLPGISRFATGLNADIAAVTAGLSLPFSSVPVEGNVNRIKMIKRQMYGRAGFDLLAEANTPVMNPMPGPRTLERLALAMAGSSSGISTARGRHLIRHALGDRRFRLGRADLDR